MKRIILLAIFQLIIISSFSQKAIIDVVAKEHSQEHEKQIIDFGKQSSGIYFAWIKIGDYQLVKKLVVQ